MGPSLIGDGNGTVTPDVGTASRLQWGRACLARKHLAEEELRALVLVASMGPSLIGDGNEVRMPLISLATLAASMGPSLIGDGNRRIS